jgi:hypothetical protein
MLLKELRLVLNFKEASSFSPSHQVYQIEEEYPLFILEYLVSYLEDFIDLIEFYPFGNCYQTNQLNSMPIASSLL